MALFEWKGDAEMQAALEKTLIKSEWAVKKMLEAAANFILFELKMANWTFQKYWKANKPKKNKLGHYVSVVPKGKTHVGTPASLAITVYEYGRGGKRPQPARPFVRKTLKENEMQIYQIMQAEYEKYLREIIHV